MSTNRKSTACKARCSTANKTSKPCKGNWGECDNLDNRVEALNYSGLNLNQYGVASPCPDLNLIHYKYKKDITLVLNEVL
ncbi:hypothetical protein A6J88_10445 [Neisseria mucosa]|uniref:Uncharacterized protein n=1 Tax=Neisseria mucosa TaxID=488 RepID=A0ABM6JE12_NEIMU|nr:hypothetical protein A6J88_10445 [Neisseria mucosa]